MTSTTSKITHIALFANNEGAIQSTGTSAENAIAAAVKDTGAKADDFVAKPVTPMMSALLAAGVTPASWVDLKDGSIDCEIDYAVFSDVGSVWNAETEIDEQIFENLHGEDIEADSAREAAIEALDEQGLDRAGVFTVVSYPRSCVLGEVLGEVSLMKYGLRAGLDARLITVEKVDLDSSED